MENNSTRSGSGEVVTTLVIVVIIPLIALTYIFYQQRNERIDCGKLSPGAIRYLIQSGEEIPPGCTTAR